MNENEKKIKPISIVLSVVILLLSICLVVVPFISKFDFFNAESGLIPVMKDVLVFKSSSFSGNFKAVAIIDGVWGYLVVACFLIGLIGVGVRKKPVMLLGMFAFLLGGVASFYGLGLVLTRGDIKALASILSLIAAAILVILSIASFMFAFSCSKSKETCEPVMEEEKIEEPSEEKGEEVKLDQVEDVESVKEEKVEEKPAEKEEEPKVEEPKKEDASVAKKPVKKAGKKVSEKVAEPKENKVESKEEKPVAKVEEAPKEAAKTTKGQTGKYEVFPEAGFYKYRLKANNGEILLVSSSYKTREGAHNGIATLRKNVKEGSKRVVTDKSGFSQFRISTANDGRLIVAGEIYPTLLSAQNALASVEKFYKTHRENDLEEIPEAEIREWKVELPPVNDTANGKVEIFIAEDGKKWQGRLLASNGVLLFMTTTYSSKNAVIKAIENIKEKALAGSISILRDKQNRYQFRVFSDNGAVLVMGETYPSRDSAISAASSVRNFIGSAKLVDLSKQN